MFGESVPRRAGALRPATPQHRTERQHLWEPERNPHCLPALANPVWWKQKGTDLRMDVSCWGSGSGLHSKGRQWPKLQFPVWKLRKSGVGAGSKGSEQRELILGLLRCRHYRESPGEPNYKKPTLGTLLREHNGSMIATFPPQAFLCGDLSLLA